MFPLVAIEFKTVANMQRLGAERSFAPEKDLWVGLRRPLPDPAIKGRT